MMKAFLFLTFFHAWLFFILFFSQGRQTYKATQPLLQLALLKSDSYVEHKNVPNKPLFLPAPLPAKILPINTEKEVTVVFEQGGEEHPVWWRQLELPSRVKQGQKEVLAQVFWRGELAPYVCQKEPLQVEQEWNLSTFRTLRYKLQVDVRHGRMLSIQALDEEAAAPFYSKVRYWLWQYPFLKAKNKEIVTGEVEICFGSEKEGR